MFISLLWNLSLLKGKFFYDDVNTSLTQYQFGPFLLHSLNSVALLHIKKAS